MFFLRQGGEYILDILDPEFVNIVAIILLFAANTIAKRMDEATLI